MTMPPGAARFDALIDEACKRSGLIWLDLPGAPQGRPAWHVWRDGAAYVVTGPGEQPLPELPPLVRDGAASLHVVVRSKETGGRLLRWEARAQRVTPGTPEWDAAVPELAAKRLNAVDSRRLPDRWAQECTVVRLEPTGTVPEHPAWADLPDSLPADSLAAEPVPTPASTAGPLPWTLARNGGAIGRFLDRMVSPLLGRSRRR